MTARRPMLSAFAVIGLIGIVVALAAFALAVLREGAGPGPPPLELPPRPTGRQMDYDWAVQTLDGEQIEVEDFRRRPIFLNFWATWCPPCVAEMPSIESLYRRMGDAGVAFVLVSNERPQAVRDFAGRHDLTVPLYTAQDIPPALAPRAIPTTYLVSPRGEVVFEQTGSAGWDDESVVEFLTALAAQGEPQ